MLDTQIGMVIRKFYWARSKKFKEVTKGVDKSFTHRYYSYIGN